MIKACSQGIPTYKLSDPFLDDLVDLDVGQPVMVAQLLPNRSFTHSGRAGEEDSNWLQECTKNTIGCQITTANWNQESVFVFFITNVSNQ